MAACKEKGGTNLRRGYLGNGRCVGCATAHDAIGDLLRGSPRCHVTANREGVCSKLERVPRPTCVWCATGGICTCLSDAMLVAGGSSRWHWPLEKSLGGCLAVCGGLVPSSVANENRDTTISQLPTASDTNKSCQY